MRQGASAVVATGGTDSVRIKKKSRSMKHQLVPMIPPFLRDPPAQRARLVCQEGRRATAHATR